MNYTAVAAFTHLVKYLNLSDAKDEQRPDPKMCSRFLCASYLTGFVVDEYVQWVMGSPMDCDLLKRVFKTYSACPGKHRVCFILI